MASAAQGTMPSSRPPFARRAWMTVGILFLAGILSVIDRSAINLLVDPLKADLGITDEQIGLLQGLAFGLFYACMGVPMGMAADRFSRRNLIAFGITVWSLATIWSGFAHSFGELFTARLLVGFGEAALSPAAISLIADLFVPERRGRPIAVFMTGQGLANGIAISVTGVILTAAAAGAFVGLPLIGGLAAWRLAFLLFGSAGLIVAAMLLVLAREPARKNVAIGPRRAPGAEEARYFWRNRAVLLPLYLGFAVCFTVAYGAGAWAPTMLMRGYGVNPAFLAAWLGPMAMAFSAIGPLIGGTLLDRSMRAGKPMARFAILTIAPLFAIPSVLAVMAGEKHLAALLVASSAAVFSVMGTVMLATLQSVVPPQMRGSAVSLTLVLNTLLGAALGPLLVASLTQRVLGDDALVGWAIAAVCLPCLLAASGLYALARRRMRSALDLDEGECARLLAAEARTRA
ncbi:MFS transporter [Novosphingobium sp. ERN07]|uniref:MFS transporter n=1 Tax=Novosphingobium sp. ERN07 TaxID=2726187 RepID=UPI00145745F9|nr:MFS transporter [Novosphingobium sp. ERN07]NLR70382.1 MFS transporter [Novosphingobium sp. ERN07]